MDFRIRADLLYWQFSLEASHLPSEIFNFFWLGIKIVKSASQVWELNEMVHVWHLSNWHIVSSLPISVMVEHRVMLRPHQENSLSTFKTIPTFHDHKWHHFHIVFTISCNHLIPFKLMLHLLSTIFVGGFYLLLLILLSKTHILTV